MPLRACTLLARKSLLRGRLHHMYRWSHAAELVNVMLTGTSPWQGCYLVASATLHEPTQMTIGCRYQTHLRFSPSPLERQVSVRSATLRVTGRWQKRAKQTRVYRIANVPHQSASCRAATGTVAQDPGKVLTWQRPAHLDRVTAPPGAPPIVILPGFGNCSSDYTAPFGVQEDAIASFLQQRGFSVYVVEVERRDWIRVARCITSRAYWSGKSTVDPGYRWYLHRVQAAVNKACQESNSEQVDLVGHSAGGWLARAFVGDVLYMKSNVEAASEITSQPGVAPGLGAGPVPARAHEGVRRIVTLGAPHLGPSSGRDMTGGTLTWLNNQWPGACFKDQGIQYTCVAGSLVSGDKDAARKSLAKYACNSYREVCGDGHGQPGDGVVPQCCAHLEGANNLVLEGVFHSISRKGTFADTSKLVWYGSDEVVDAWLPALL